MADPLEIAQQAMAAAGYPARLEMVSKLTGEGRRTSVFRCRVDGDVPARTVVVKQLTEHETASPARLGLLRDWSALRLLSALDPDGAPTPRFLAGDSSENLMVLEDLGDGESLVEPLQAGSSEKASALLIEAATVLATVHGTTVGKAETYRGLRLELGPDEPSGAFIPGDWLELLTRAADRLRVHLDAGFLSSASDVLAGIREPGPSFSVVHGDPCPDKITGWLPLPGCASLTSSSPASPMTATL